MIHNFLRLNQTYRQLLNDNEALTSDHKQLKSQLNEAKLEHTWLEADFSKLKKDYQQLDITCTKLTNQCEVCCEQSDGCIKKTTFNDFFQMLNQFRIPKGLKPINPVFTIAYQCVLLIDVYL